MGEAVTCPASVATKPNVLACPVQAECGGCPQLHLTLAEQRARKLSQVAQAFERAGVRVPELHWCGVSEPGPYRNRLRLRVHDGHVDYFNTAKSQECAVLLPELRKLIESLRLSSRRFPELLRGVAHLEARAPDDWGTSGLFLALDDEQVRVDRAALRDALQVPCSIGARGDTPMPAQRFWFAEGVFGYVPVSSFMQVNTTVNRRLVRHVLDGARERGIHAFVDLYAGAGNFSLPLAGCGIRGTAVECDGAATQALDRARAEQMLPCEVRVADAAAWLHERQRIDSDLLIADPPRAGLRDAARDIVRLGPEYVLLCSCRVGSHARDLAALSSYRVERTTAFDMFPHTEHLEVVSWLRWRD